METEQQIEINTRLGLRKIDRDKIIHFPKALAGLDGLHEYVLLQIRPESPMLMLQSVELEEMGLVVADPHTFIPDYTYTLDPAEQKLLGLEDTNDTKDIMVIVTVSIPHGKPEESSLSLTGPIIINPTKKIGLQIMQMNITFPKQFKLKKIMENKEASDKDTSNKDESE